jgi:hypothetical protein
VSGPYSKNLKDKLIKAQGLEEGNKIFRHLLEIIMGYDLDSEEFIEGWKEFLLSEDSKETLIYSLKKIKEENLQ